MEKIIRVDYAAWAEEFLSAQCEPLYEKHSRWFAIGIVAELEKQEPEPLPNQLVVHIMQSRGISIGLKITSFALMTIAGMTYANPGIAVMYTYALRYWQMTHEDREITMEVLGEEIFPLGLPTHDELLRLWELQKEGGANMLDRIIPEEEVSSTNENN
jgi:hypothetical protein